jgi:DnaK suppressor protein
MLGVFWPTQMMGVGEEHRKIGAREEVVVDDERARELVAGERARVEAALRELTGDVRAEGDQQAGEREDSGSELTTEMVDLALVDNLRDKLEAVIRAEQRIAQGTYGQSVDSGLAIPDERLEAEPLAERTIDEQRRYDEGAR